jgi:hypothetical protein
LETIEWELAKEVAGSDANVQTAQVDALDEQAVKNHVAAAHEKAGRIDARSVVLIHHTIPCRRNRANGQAFPTHRHCARAAMATICAESKAAGNI